MSIVFPKLSPVLQQNMDYFRTVPTKALRDQTPALVQNNCSYCGGNHPSQSHNNPSVNTVPTPLMGPQQDLWHAIYQGRVALPR